MHISFFGLEIQFIREWKHVKTDLLLSKGLSESVAKLYLSEKVDKLHHTPSTS